MFEKGTKTLPTAYQNGAEMHPDGIFGQLRSQNDTKMQLSSYWSDGCCLILMPKKDPTQSEKLQNGVEIEQTTVQASDQQAKPILIGLKHDF